MPGSTGPFRITSIQWFQVETFNLQSLPGERQYPHGCRNRQDGSNFSIAGRVEFGATGRQRLHHRDGDPVQFVHCVRVQRVEAELRLECVQTTRHRRLRDGTANGSHRVLNRLLIHPL